MTTASVPIDNSDVDGRIKPTQVGKQAGFAPYPHWTFILS